MAVDLPGWRGYPVWDPTMARAVRDEAAKDCGSTLRWGGDWDRDGDEKR